MTDTEEEVLETVLVKITERATGNVRFFLVGEEDGVEYMYDPRTSDYAQDGNQELSKYSLWRSYHLGS